MKARREAATWVIPLLIAANLAIPLAIVTFAKGFFPYKPLLPGLAQYENVDGDSRPPAQFDRLVFMVVDALRSDFVYTRSSGFQFTQSLIRDGAALPFTAHATSPTVTMPRIKAITTGSIPSFLDVVLNLDEGDKSSSLASQDSWLVQMKAKGTGKLVLYGDDTWLKLFPDTFDRADGTSSFFVADFTEVDNNVTRHVPDELKNDDWNTMILHYLGLDHIGHKGGPRSPNMIPKQHEMDGIVKEIYEAMSSQSHLQSTLLILIGDHGMNDAGNHGASSAGETSPALVFISPKLKALGSNLQSPLEVKEDFRYYSTIEQSDLAPTLGGLFGFPVPRNNLGAFISELLPLWSNDGDKKALLSHNVQQILGVVTAAFGPELFDLTGDPPRCEDSDINELACEWRRISQGAADMTDEEWISLVSKWLRDAQQIVGSMASNYDMPKLVLGQAIAVIALVLAGAAAYLVSQDGLGTSLPLLMVTLGYGTMMFASSYVEEEHHFWYWSATAWLSFVEIKGMIRGKTPWSFQAAWLALNLLALRLIRGWNQTGQKFAGEPDLVKTYLYTNPKLLWTMVGATYLWLSTEIGRGFASLPVWVVLPGILGIMPVAFNFKHVFTEEDSPELVANYGHLLFDLTFGASLVTRARIVFLGLAVASLCVIGFTLAKQPLSPQVLPTRTLRHLYTVLAATQSRVTNIPLFFLHDMLLKTLAGQGLARVEVSTAILLLQRVSFFAAGGTNAISSIDLSSAYNGISGFNAPAVGLLTFVSNWAAPIYWAVAASGLLARRRRSGEPRPYVGHVATLTLFATAGVAAVMGACTALRTHLFIWTVFSPKYLYCVAWEVGMHLGVNVGLTGFLYWVGTR